jgi:predicted phage terminase large subunit-like protein
MSSWHGQVDYPDLLEKVLVQGRDERVHCQLIEKKASGISIVQNMKKAVHDERKKGRHCAPIRTYMPDRDKEARAYAVQDMLRRGDIWYPDRKWADAVIGHVAAFPNGMPPSADLTDTCTQAWLYVQKGWWLNMPDDDKDKPKDEEEDNPKQRQKAVYG